MYRVLEDIYCMLSLGIDSNIYIIRDKDNLMIIDTGLGFRIDQIFMDMINKGFKLNNVKYVVNTHCHIDHIGGNKYFINKSQNAKILVHEIDAKFMINGDAKAIEPTGLLGYSIKPFRVDKVLRDGDKLNFGSYKLVVIHSPGHSPGSICLYDEEYKILISGDTVFLEGVGRYDFHYSNYKDLVSSIEKLAELDVEVLLPGHGPFTVKDGYTYIKRNLRWIKGII